MRYDQVDVLFWEGNLELAISSCLVDLMGEMDMLDEFAWKQRSKQAKRT
jgi:hypothetical protein